MRRACHPDETSTLPCQNFPNSAKRAFRASRDSTKRQPCQGCLFVVNALCGASSIPVPLARVGPPRLKRAPWRSVDIGPVLVDELLLMTVDVDPGCNHLKRSPPGSRSVRLG